MPSIPPFGDDARRDALTDEGIEGTLFESKDAIPRA